MTHYSAVPFTMSSQDSEKEKKREIWNQPDFYPVLEKAAALAYLEDVNFEVYIWECALFIVWTKFTKVHALSISFG